MQTSPAAVRYRHLGRTHRRLRVPRSVAPLLSSCYGCDKDHIGRYDTISRGAAACCRSEEVEQRWGGRIPHSTCAKISNPNDPDQCHERGCYEEHWQHNSHNCGLLTGIGAVSGAPSYQGHIEQTDDGENDHDVEQLVGKQGVLQDQIAYRVTGLDLQRRIERQTALSGDKGHYGGSDDDDRQRPTRPFPALGECEEERQENGQRDADDNGVDHQRMEWKVSDLVEHALSSGSVVWAGRTRRTRA